MARDLHSRTLAGTPADFSVVDLHFLIQRPDVSANDVVEEMCTDQVQRWRRGERVPAETYLQLDPRLAADPELALTLIFGEFALRESLGDKPTPAEYLWRFPHLAERLQRQFALHEALSDDANEAATAQREAVFARHETAPAEGGPRDPSWPDIPGYVLLEQVGRGGMGVVYKAQQVGLHRFVALKMILGGSLASPEEMARFFTEAKMVARLHHPNIVQIYQIGRQGDIPFFSLEFVAGGTLQEYLAGTPQQPRAAAQLIECLARAMHYAHEHGIIHRDLKPGNVLLQKSEVRGQRSEVRSQKSEVRNQKSEEGDCQTTSPDLRPLTSDLRPLTSDFCPKITDFGLAKRMEGGDNLTHTGAIVGTPSYMAPEQAEAKKEIGPAVDIYALGAILYEMLTGRPPFRGPTSLDTLRQVQSEEPVPPKRLQPGCPRDLETICLKCLHKDAHRRYATAAALAEDLQRFLTDQPIRARRHGTLERGRRWCRRNPVLAGMTAALALLLSVQALGATFAALLLRQERNQAWESRDQTRKAEHRRADQLAVSLLQQARARRYSRQAGQRFQSLEALAEAARIVRTLDLDDERREQRLLELRNEVIACLSLADLRPWRRLADVFIETHGTGFQQTVAFPPSWKVYARAEAGGPISIRDVDGDQEIVRLPGAGPTAYILIFSPDGRYLAAKYYQREKPIEYIVWDWRDNRPVVRQPCDANISPTIDFAFPPDSGSIWLGCRADGSLGHYDLATGKEVRRLDGMGETFSFALSADGRQMAVTGGGNVVTIRDAQTGVEMGSPWHLPANVWTVAWNRAGDLLAVGAGRHIHLLDPVTHQPRGVLEEHESVVVKLAFNPAGTLLASFGWDNTTRLWDVASGKELLSVPGDFLQFSPDGRQLAYVKGRQLGIWEVAEPNVYRPLVHTQNLRQADFSADDRLLTVATDDGATLWDAEYGKPLARLPSGYTEGSFFDAKGDCLTLSQKNVLRWPLQRPPKEGAPLRVGRPSLLPLSIDRRISSAQLDAAGRKLAVVDSQTKAVVTTLDGEAPLILTGHPRMNYLDLSPDGRWLATSTFKGVDVKVWDLAASAPRRLAATLPGGDRSSSCFSRDNCWLVIFDWVHSVRSFYRVGSWELVRQEDIEGNLNGMNFAAGGMMAVTVDGGRGVRLLDPAAGRTWAVLPSATGQRVSFLRFNHAGTHLLAGGDRFVQLWDLRRVRNRLAELGLDWPADPYPPAAGSASPPLTAVFEKQVEVPPTQLAPPRAAQPNEIAEWIRQLDDADEQVRQTAIEALIAAGRPAVAALTQALEDSEGECRKQAQLVLDRITAAEALAPTRVQLKLENVPLADAIRQLAAQTGLPLAYDEPPDATKLKRISLNLKDVPAWEALDRLCESAGLGYNRQQPSTLRLSEQLLPPVARRAYPGPFSLHLVSCLYQRDVIFVRNSDPTHEFLQLRFDLLTEPRVAALTAKKTLRLTEATDTEGLSLLPEPAASFVSIALDSNRAAPLAALLKPPERRNARLKVVKGFLSVEMPAQPQQLLTVPQLAKAQGRTYHGQLGHRVTLESVQTTPLANGSTQWDLRLRLCGPREAYQAPNLLCLEIVGDQGQWMRLHPRPPAGTLTPQPLGEPQQEDLAWFAPVPTGSGPLELPWAALALQPFRQQRASWVGTFRVITPASFARSTDLRIYCCERVWLELPFELHDVPLP